MEKVVGKTKDAGYQFGLRKTFPISLTRAWNFLVSKPGVESWLGDVADMQVKVNFEYQSVQGNTGKISVVKPLSHI